MRPDRKSIIDNSKVSNEEILAGLRSWFRDASRETWRESDREDMYRLILAVKEIRNRENDKTYPGWKEAREEFSRCLTETGNVWVSLVQAALTKPDEAGIVTIREAWLAFGGSLRTVPDRDTFLDALSTSAKEHAFESMKESSEKSSGRYLTIVYKNVTKEESSKLLNHPLLSVASMSDAIRDRDSAYKKALARVPFAYSFERYSESLKEWIPQIEKVLPDELPERIKNVVPLFEMEI